MAAYDKLVASAVALRALACFTLVLLATYLIGGPW